MCMMESRRCFCGRQFALVNLYCPECSPQTGFDAETMVADCDWIMEYDMDRAQVFFNKKGLAQTITPEAIFDEGYLTWQGFSPGDHEIRAEIKQRLAPLIQGDMNQYLQALKGEWLAHVDRLKAAGWRRAQQA
jgi:hypothetical protein